MSRFESKLIQQYSFTSIPEHPLTVYSAPATFLPSRRCARAAVLDMTVRLSVRPSVTSRCRPTIETLSRSILILAQKLPSAYPPLFYGNLSIFKNSRVFPCGTFSQTLGLKKFRNCASNVASIINLVRPMTVISLSH